MSKLKYEHTVDGENLARSDPYEKTRFRGMGVTKPYEFIWFRDTHATEPYFFIGIGACKILSPSTACCSSVAQLGSWDAFIEGAQLYILRIPWKF
jgi:hypothetical protein